MNDKLKQLEQELEAEALRINAGRKPKFGDLMRNPWASESNPIRDGYFVRKCGAGFDAYYEFTNGNGKFWKTRARFAFFIEAARATPAQPDEQKYTYASTQATKCAVCFEHKHTPLRVDEMGGYVCLTCIDKRLCGLLGEFGYSPSPSSVGAAIRALPLPAGDDYCASKGIYAFTAHQVRALLSEAAALAEQVQQWVSVSDKMPPVGQEVIVYRPSDKYRKIDFDTWEEQYEAPLSEYPNNQIPIGLGWNENEFEEVTHWMPTLVAPIAHSE